MYPKERIEKKRHIATLCPTLMYARRQLRCRTTDPCSPNMGKYSKVATLMLLVRTGGKGREEQGMEGKGGEGKGREGKSSKLAPIMVLVMISYPPNNM